MKNPMENHQKVQIKMTAVIMNPNNSRDLKIINEVQKQFNPIYHLKMVIVKVHK